MSRKVMFTKPAFNVPYMLRKAYLQSSLSTPYILFRAWTLDHINYTLRRACNKGLYIIRFVGLGGLERFTPASSKRVNMAYFTLPAGVKTFHALKKGDGFGGVYNIRGNPMAQRRCSSENNYRLVRENRTQHFIILQQVPIPLKDLTNWEMLVGISCHQGTSKFINISLVNPTGSLKHSVPVHITNTNDGIINLPLIISLIQKSHFQDLGLLLSREYWGRLSINGPCVRAAWAARYHMHASLVSHWGWSDCTQPHVTI